MQGPSLIWLEVLLGFAVPLGWAGWELFDLRRERERDRIKAAARLSDSTLPGDDWGTARR